MLINLFPPSSYDPPTSVAYAYQADERGEKGRWETMKGYWEELTKNFELWLKGTNDKQKWHSNLVYGFSGVGKTRFTLELLSLLQKYSQTEEANSYAHIDELRKMLQETRMVYLDIHHNGNGLDDREMNNRSKFTLGFRVACAYWYPGCPVNQVEAALKRKYSFSNYDYLKAFDLIEILHLMKLYPDTLNKVRSYHGKATYASKPSGFLIIIDEIQYAANFQVKYEGSQRYIGNEPLSKSYYRQILQASAGFAGNKHLYLFSLFSGLSSDPGLLALDPSEYPTAKTFLLNTLSLEASKAIVKGWKSEKWKGEDWLECYGERFERLLLACGGNARCLEGLEQALIHEEPSKQKELKVKAIGDKVSQFVNRRWRANKEELMATLIALSGIPVSPSLPLSFSKEKQQPTVRDLQTSGYVQLLPALADSNSPWTKSSDHFLYVPLYIADATIGKVEAFKTDELNQLYKEARDLLSVSLHHDNTPSEFESFVFRQNNFRYNLAMYLARLKGSAYIDSKDLFYGAFCQKLITTLQFEVTSRLEVMENHVAGTWCDNLEGIIPESLTIQNSNMRIKIFEAKENPIAFQLAGKNVFDTARYALLHPSKNGVIIWNDQTHGQASLQRPDLTLNKIDTIIKKAELIEKKRPSVMHIVCGATNKPYGSFCWNEQGVLMVGAKNKPVPDNVCFWVSKNIEQLVSPVLAPFFSKATTTR